MPAPAPRCSFPACRGKTTDPSGRCHHHRGKRVYSVPDPATLYPRVVGTPKVKSYRRVEDLPGGGTEETWSYSKRGWSGIVLHRVDGPARIEHGSWGGITREEWWVEGELTRVDGPAQVTYYESGAVEREQWRVHGELSRIDGPAETIYDEDGESIEVWWFAGRRAGRGREDVVRRMWGEPAWLVHHAIDASSYRALLLEGRSYGDVMELLEAGVVTAEGMREVLGGAPVEWVRSWEMGRT